MVVCFVDYKLQRFLGLGYGSMHAVYNGSHIICSYSRLITVYSHDAEAVHVMNLSTPRYILLARGPTNDEGDIQLVSVMCNVQSYTKYI